MGANYRSVKMLNTEKSAKNGKGEWFVTVREPTPRPELVLEPVAG